MAEETSEEVEEATCRPGSLREDQEESTSIKMRSNKEEGEALHLVEALNSMSGNR